LHDALISLARALASGVESEHPHEEPDALEGQHEEIRRAIAQSIRTRVPVLADVAAELALGAHPWPDVETGAPFRRDVVQELNPWLNERHPDVREVVADRLQRLAEVFRDQGLPEAVWRRLEGGATRLADRASFRTPIDASSLSVAVRDVMGVGPAPESPPAAVEAKQPTSFDTAAAAAILASIARTGSLDLGSNLGSDPIGTSIDVVLLAAGVREALQPFDTWVAQADPRTRDLLVERVFTFDEAPTLNEIGERWGLSRERVRQLEVRARDEIESSFRSMWTEAARALQSLTSVVLPTHRFLLACRSLGVGLAYPDVAAASVVVAAGPWVHQDGWTHHSSVTSLLDAAHEAIRATCDEYGLLPADALSHLDGFFTSQGDQGEYFRGALGAVELSGYWSLRDSQRTRVAAALRRIGRPATKVEIALEARVDDFDRVGSTLSALPGIVRADKGRWAFDAWVDDPYDGIVGEIYQRISANHGSVAVVSLLEELPRRYGVSEASVHAYLQTPAFILEDGFVRRADAGAFEAAPPSKWPDAFEVGELWGQLVRIEDRHFGGYSFKVRFDIAYANGVRPDDDLRVPVHGSSTEASVIWRPHDATKAVDVGRVTEVLIERGLSPGDRVVVCPSRSMVVIANWDESLRPRSVPQSTTSRDQHDPLFDLLGDG
jgi:hypothetical protein